MSVSEQTKAQIRVLLDRSAQLPWIWDEEFEEVRSSDPNWIDGNCMRGIIETDMGYYGPREDERKLLLLTVNNIEALLDEIDALKQETRHE